MDFSIAPANADRENSLECSYILSWELHLVNSPGINWVKQETNLEERAHTRSLMYAETLHLPQK